ENVHQSHDRLLKKLPKVERRLSCRRNMPWSLSLHATTIASAIPGCGARAAQLGSEGQPQLVAHLGACVPEEGNGVRKSAMGRKARARRNRHSHTLEPGPGSKAANPYARHISCAVMCVTSLLGSTARATVALRRVTRHGENLFDLSVGLPRW